MARGTGQSGRPNAKRLADAPMTRGSGSGRMAREVVGPGLAAGWFAGLVMALAACLTAAFAGRGFLAPLQWVAGSVMGGAAVRQGQETAALGIVIHLLVAGGFGVLFNALLPRTILGAQVFFWGLLYGSVIYLFMTWLVLPRADEVLWSNVNHAVLYGFHLLYGGLLPLALPLRRGVGADRLELGRRRREV